MGPGVHCSVMSAHDSETYCTEMPSAGGEKALLLYTFHDNVFRLVIVPSSINTSVSAQKRAIVYSLLRDLRSRGAELRLENAYRGWRLPSDLSEWLKGISDGA